MRKLQRLPMVLLAVIGGCSERGDGGTDNVAAVGNEPSATVLPTPQPPLDREALLIATLRAASAAATGANDAGAQRALDARPFALVLRFGCPGSDVGRDGSVEERGDAENRSVLLRSRPDVSLDDPLLVPNAETAGIEAVEGFWITRPWLLTAACPPPPAAPAAAGEEQRPSMDPAAAPAQRRVAIAQFFTGEDTRVGRRSERPFEAVLKADEARGLKENGFNLVLAGRLRAMRDGKVIRCTVTDPRRPPDCLISARFDQVRMEHPRTGAVLAQWAD